MSFAISVKGGTGAGVKRPLLPAYTIPWPCQCPVDAEAHGLQDAAGGLTLLKFNPGYLRRCVDCGTERPDAQPA